MSNGKPAQDNVEALLAGRKSAMSKRQEEIGLFAIDEEASASVQFRDTLSGRTLESMADTLEEGGSLPPIWVVECVIEEGENGVYEVRPVRPTDTSDEICYLTADGRHRTKVAGERHQRLLDEAGGDPQKLPPPTIRAIVVRGAQNPLAVARELSIRLNITPGTAPTENERKRAILTLHELHPDLGSREVGRIVGRSHTQVIRLWRVHEVRQVLQDHHVSEPSDLHLEYMYEVGSSRYPEYQRWIDLARVIKSERWKADDLHLAIRREKAISAGDWSDLDPKDFDQTPRALRDWNNTDIVTRIRLAYTANERNWTDEQLVRSAGYLDGLQGEVITLQAEKGREATEERRAAEHEVADMLHGRLDPSFWMPEPEPQSPRAPEPEPTPEPASTATITPFPQPAPTTEPEATTGISSVAAEAEEEATHEEARRRTVRLQRHETMDAIERALVRLEAEGADEVTDQDIADLHAFATRLTALANVWFDALPPQQQVAH